VSYGVTHSANSQTFGDWDAEENQLVKGKGNLGWVWSGCSHLPVRSHLWNSKCAGTTWPWTLTLSTPWMQALLGIIACKFGGDPAICLVEEAICTKCLQTVRQTDDGRHTIISSRNELKNESYTIHKWVYFSNNGNRPHWTDFHKNWQDSKGRWRNHLTQFLFQYFYGFQMYGGGSKFPFLHWLCLTLLQQTFWCQVSSSIQHFS